MKVIIMAVVVAISGFAGFAIGRRLPTGSEGTFSVQDIQPDPPGAPQKSASFADDLAALKREQKQKQGDKYLSTDPNAGVPIVESIMLGAELKIGMPQAQVLDDLGNYYRLQKLERSTETRSSWFVKEREGAADQVIGSLAFETGRLIQVQKDWASDRKAVEFATALLGALSDLSAGGERNCVLNSRQHQEPQMESHGASVQCGTKEVDLYVGNTRRYGKWAQVSEYLR